MAITAAQVETNGWVLRVTMTGSRSAIALAPDTPAQWAANFAAYALNPNGASPALTLTGTTNGFIPSGGTAVVSSTVARTLTATKVLRKAVVATAAGIRDAKNPDETDNGDGTITIRLALSQHVYAGDAGLTLTALTGWRTGATAQTIAVTNNSTVAAPAPIVRWTDVPYQLQPGSFVLECAIVSHHPNALVPVAGVKFTVTDGTTVKTLWTMTLSTSPLYPATTGDGAAALALRVYAVTVDPTTATALTKGLLRCDYEVYPWIGPVQKSDTVGTRSMTNLGTAALATAAQVPFVVAYNPGNSWIVPRFAYVSASGATAAAAANVSTTASAAAATPLATINLAIESLRLWSAANAGSVGTLAAANGQAAITQSVDGCRIRLVAGVTTAATTTAVTFGVNTNATWLVIEGDPADANPRANCILRGGASNVAGWQNVSRVRFTGLAMEAATGKFAFAPYAWCDNFEFRNATPTDTAAYYGWAASPGLVWATNGKWWKAGLSPATLGSQHNPILVRAVTVERSLNAPIVVSCARLPSAIAGTAGITSTGTNVTDAGVGLDRLAIGNDLRFLNGAPAFTMQNVAFSALPAGLVLGKTYPAASRHAFVNNVGEIYGGQSPLWYGVGENTTVVSSENVIEGNIFAGDRVNAWYNSLTLATIALNDTEDCQARVNRYANNVTLKNATKQDAYFDPVVQALRIGVALSATRNKAYAVGAQIVVAGSPANVYQCTATTGNTAATGGPAGTGSAIADGGVTWQWIATETRQHGYRPQALGMWSAAYGVGFEGNIDLESANDSLGSVEYYFEFYGVGSQSLYGDGITIATGPFVLDKSGTANKQPYQVTPDTSGGGNYTPLTTASGAYILGRAKSANVDVDQRGLARSVPFAAGALGVPVYALTPNPDRQASRAAVTATGWATTLALARSVLATRAGITATGWTAMLVPRSGAAGTRAAAAQTGWTTQLSAAATIAVTRTTSTAAGWATLLRPIAGAAATRAATTVTAWTAIIGARGTTLATRAATTVTAWATQVVLPANRLASRARASVTGWATTIPAAPGRLPSVAATGTTGWTVTLIVDLDRAAMRAGTGVVTWLCAVSPASARSLSAATGSIVAIVGGRIVVIDSGRIGIADRTLPILLPGSATPRERTLIVTGDFRTTTIA